MGNKKKTIIIDIEAVMSKPKTALDERFLPTQRAGAEELLKTLNQKYIIWVYTKNSMGITAEWCTRQGLDKYLHGVINRKRNCYLHITRH